MMTTDESLLIAVVVGRVSVADERPRLQSGGGDAVLLFLMPSQDGQGGRTTALAEAEEKREVGSNS